MYCRKFLLAYYPRHTTWWNWMLKKDYGHVDVYTEIAGGFMLINTNFVGICLHEQYFTREEILTLDNVIFQEYIVSIDQLVETRFRGLITCVSVVKSLLFIKKWWVITPYHLYKYLGRTNHGKPIQNT